MAHLVKFKAMALRVVLHPFAFEVQHLCSFKRHACPVRTASGLCILSARLTMTWPNYIYSILTPKPHVHGAALSRVDANLRAEEPHPLGCDFFSCMHRSDLV